MRWLTIVVPVYNVERYVSDCLKSILAQGSDDILVIAVDDGSPDGSGRICDEIAASDPRVTVVHKENGGVSSARNVGIELCRTEWIWFVDSDDLIRPDSVKLLKAALGGLKRHCDILMFDYRNFGSEARRKYTGAARSLSSDEVAQLRLHNLYKGKRSSVSHIHASSVCYTIYRTNFLKEKELRFTEGVPRGQDALFVCRALASAPDVAWLDEDPYIYRQNEGSISIKYNACNSENLLMLFNTYKKLLDELYPDNADMEKRYKNRVIYNALRSLLINYSNRDNPKKYRVRRREFMEFMDNPLIGNNLPRIRDVSDGIPYKIMYTLLKMRCFFILNIVYRLYSTKK